MKTSLKIDLTLDQIVSLIKQLSEDQKIKLAKELEKEAIDSKLSGILKKLKTDELGLDIVAEETEIVRKGVYDKKRKA